MLEVIVLGTEDTAVGQTSVGPQNDGCPAEEDVQSK